MPNIGTLLKQEIARLSRKESRGEIEPTRKASAHFRKDIAELKRKVMALERQVAILERRTVSRAMTAPTAADQKQLRYSAKGLHSQRTRLGLSAADYVLEVSRGRGQLSDGCGLTDVAAKRRACTYGPPQRHR